MTAAMAQRPRTLHVEHCMGTAFTIDIRDPGQWTDAVADVVGWLHHVDAVFSTYRPGSDISRIRRGELDVADADPDVTEVLELCVLMHRETGGYFSALWNGRLDPTGLVKGWAVERAAALLTSYGSRNHAVSGGGDMQLVGEASPGEPWRIGVSDPHDRARVLRVVSGRDFAVATSGNAERGDHVVDPFTGESPRALASVTVTGRSLTRVDCYATAAFAMDGNAAAWLESKTGHEALLVDDAGTLIVTSGWRDTVITESR